MLGKLSLNILNHSRRCCIALLSATWFAITSVGGIVAATAARVCLHDIDAFTLMKTEREDYFKGKVAWVTGASSGVGRSIALQLARRGCPVLIISARRLDMLDQVAEECRALASVLKHQLVVHVVPFDMMKMEEIDAAVTTVGDLTNGEIHLLFHNAGVAQRGVLSDYNVDSTILTLNFLSHLRLTKQIFKLQARGISTTTTSTAVMSSNDDSSPTTGASTPPTKDISTGTPTAQSPPPSSSSSSPKSAPLHIVVTGSLQSRFPMPSRAAYCASKHAMHAFFAALHAESEVLGLGVTVTQCLLGYVATDISLNALLADGKSPTHKDPNHSGAHVMSSERAASLMLSSAAKGVKESWVTSHPHLCYMYLYYYAPMLAALLGLEFRSVKKVVMADLAYTRQQVEGVRKLA